MTAAGAAARSHVAAPRARLTFVGSLVQGLAAGCATLCLAKPRRLGRHGLHAASSSRQPTQESLVRRLLSFAKSKGIKTTGVLAVTIHENRSARFSSMVIDTSSLEVLPSYDREFPKTYHEIRVGGFIVVYCDALPPCRQSLAWPSRESALAEDAFCCACLRLRPYKPKTLDWEEEYFADFCACRGTRSDMIYEVREQVNNGPTVAIRYFRLVDGKRVVVQGDFTRKTTGYKNYICDRHNRFFSVNMYYASESKDRTFHHMRCIPYTRQQDDVLGRFLEEAGW